MPQASAQFDPFNSTRWSLVLAVRQDDTRAAEALDALCTIYWAPVHSYVRRHLRNPQDAEDLTQDFFAKLLKDRRLDEADPAKGRLRAFLLTSLRFFLCNAWRISQAEKRGGGAEIVSLDAEWAEELSQPANTEPDLTFDREWANHIIERARLALRDQYSAVGKAGVFEALCPYLDKPLASVDGDRLATATGMNSAGAVKTELSRMKGRLAGTLRAVVLDTLEDPAELEAELSYLFSVLVSNPPA